MAYVLAKGEPLLFTLHTSGARDASVPSLRCLGVVYHFFLILASLCTGSYTCSLRAGMSVVNGSYGLSRGGVYRGALGGGGLHGLNGCRGELGGTLWFAGQGGSLSTRDRVVEINFACDVYSSFSYRLGARGVRL